MKKVAIGILLAVIVLTAIWPVFDTRMFRTHDYVHGARIAELYLAAKDGHWPVRWTKNFGFGYGMPLFEFYAPLPYYIGGFVYWLTRDLILAVKLLWVIPSLLSCVGAYLLAKRWWGRSAGVVAAAMFTLAPYRAVDLFVRGAIGEIWGMMAFPWIFLAMLLIFQKHKWGWQLLFWSLLTLFLSHNLMTLLFAPFIGIWLLVLIWLYRRELALKTFSLKKVLLHPVGQFLSAAVLAAGTSAFYVLPALTENSFTQMKMRILDGYFHYSLHFLYIRQFFQENWQYEGSVWGPNDGISFFLGYPQLALLVVGTVIGAVIGLKMIWDVIKKKKFPQKGFSYFGWLVLLSGCLGISLFFSLYRAKPLWDALPALQVAQFPWRFLSLAIFFLALLNAVVVAHLPSKLLRILTVIIIVIVSLSFGSRYFKPGIWLDNPEELYYADEQRIVQQMSGILPDYIPIEMPKEPVPRGDERVKLVEGEMKDDQLLVERTHELAFRAEWLVDSTMELQLAEYPGWQVYLDVQAIEHTVGENGLILVHVPAGKHILSAKFKNTPIRLAADLISLTSSFVWLLVSVQPKTNIIDKKKNHDS